MSIDIQKMMSGQFDYLVVIIIQFKAKKSAGGFKRTRGMQMKCSYHDFLRSEFKFAGSVNDLIVV